MLITCRSCGQRSPDAAACCTDCGAALHVLAPVVRGPARGATGPTIRLTEHERDGLPSPAASLGARALPVAGLLFTIVFIFGLASYLVGVWTRPLGFWPVGVLVLGALLAQQAWLHGQVWRGLCGMLLWGGMIWLLAIDRAVPWGAVLLIGWGLLRPIGRLHRRGESHPPADQRPMPNAERRV